MKITKQAYAEMYGPTTGDRVRLADTELIIEVEQRLRRSTATKSSSAAARSSATAWARARRPRAEGAARHSSSPTR